MYYRQAPAPRVPHRQAGLPRAALLAVARAAAAGRRAAGEAGHLGAAQVAPAGRGQGGGGGGGANQHYKDLDGEQGPEVTISTRYLPTSSLCIGCLAILDPRSFILAFSRPNLIQMAKVGCRYTLHYLHTWL